jgi:hypothetical protein
MLYPFAAEGSGWFGRKRIEPLPVRGFIGA